MTKQRMAAIWLDHQQAHVYEYMNNVQLQEKLVVKLSDANHGGGASEHVLHNKENHHLKEYYHKLATMIRNYEEVLLFGPKGAKEELVNSIKDQHLFSEIKISTKDSDRLSDPQEKAFVNDYFATKA